MKIGQSEALSKELATEEQDLLNMASRADAGEDISTPESDQTGNRSPELDAKPDETAAQKTEQIQKGAEAPKAEGETGTQDKSKTPETAGKDPASNPSESKFQQAKKEQERRERSWKALNEQKEALRLERETMLKEKAEALERAQAAERKAAEALAKSTQTEISAKEYDEAARDYKEDAKRLEARGEYEAADKLLQKARACERIAAQKRDEEKSIKENHEKLSKEAEVEKFRKAWDENLQKIKKMDEYKDLEDPRSPLGLETTRLIRDNPMLSAYPEGIRDAAMIAKWKMTAESLPGVLAKLAESEKKYSELASRMRIGPSGNPEPPKAAKAFEDMSMDDQEKELLSLANQLDNG